MADQLNPELLLALFKSLNPRDMIQSKRVCRAWSDVINGNKSLYRHLVLPRRKGGWNIRILKLFDEKSNGGLVEISMQLDHSIRQCENLRQVLDRSKDSLRRISIIWADDHTSNATDALLFEIFFGMPRLLELKIQKICEPHPSQTSSVLRKVSNGNPSPSSNPQVLWLPRSDCFSSSPTLPLNLLGNLVSFRLDEPLNYYEWRDLLEACSKTLKDLKMSFRQTIISPFRPEPTELEFPELKFLSIDGGWDVPEWMKIPISCTIKIQVTESSRIPSVSRLFVGFIDRSAHLSNLCPLLKELRVEVSHLPDWATATDDVAWRDWTWERREELKNMGILRDAEKEKVECRK